MTTGPVLRRTADGRELRYFDDEPRGRAYDAVDTRDLPPLSSTSELRLDPLLDEWVAVAGHRQDRTFLPPADQCPLCPSRDGRQSEIAEPAYDVVVFDNRFPALGTSAQVQVCAPLPLAQDAAALLAVPSRGFAEVVVPTDDHLQTTADLPPARLRTLVDVWAQRTEALGARPGVRAVAVFENRGEAVGVTLSHTHQQIYAYPFVPPRLGQVLRASAAHRERTGGCLVEDRLAVERADGQRIVLAGQAWTVLVPHAARWPFELHVVPHRHVRALPELAEDERDELAALWGEVFRRYDALPAAQGAPLPTIAAWVQPPVGAVEGHLYAQVFSLARAPGKLKSLAGSESAYGAWVTDTTPEATAQALRDAG